MEEEDTGKYFLPVIHQKIRYCLKKESIFTNDTEETNSDDKHLLAASIPFDITETKINLTLAGKEKDEMLEKRLEEERSGKRIGTEKDNIEILQPKLVRCVEKRKYEVEQ
ncbi:hypothetical protein X798_04917 [Onchocerca flexuosa]|uniref:Uncharacterized protein n=1 Tax=Onchocerca flexuosa TaxID=387005 RepID=A0A238BTK6_9BILA|nr:hypothetical protein X798_04917 [Onchocerca flexuosa]